MLNVDVVTVVCPFSCLGSINEGSYVPVDDNHKFKRDGGDKWN